MASLKKSWHFLGASVLALQNHTLPENLTNESIALTNDVPSNIVTASQQRVYPKLAMLSLESVVDDTSVADANVAWKPAHSNAFLTLQQLYEEGYDIILLSSLVKHDESKEKLKPWQKEVRRQEKQLLEWKSQQENQAHSPEIGNIEIPKPEFLSVKDLVLEENEKFLERIESLIDALHIPVSVYVALANDMYAIPARGMFDLILDQYYDLWAKHTAKDPPATLIDPALSFYVGERSGGLLSSSDHGLSSSSDGKGSGGVVGEVQYKPADDRAFAHNIGLSYLKPALLFNATSPVERGQVVANADKLMQEMEPAWKYYGFAYPVTLFTHITANDVHNRVSLAADAMLPEIPAYFSSLPTPHVIMLSGPPASGRTTLSEYFFPDHVQINSNTKRSGRDPLAELTPHITAGKNIVVDRLHHRIDDRNKVTDACRKLNVPLYGVAVTAPLQACYAVRTVCNQSSRGNIELVPNMAYLDYQLFYKAPSIEEGFKDIISTPWIPRFPELPTGGHVFDHTHDCVSSETYTPPYKSPFGKSPIFPDAASYSQRSEGINVVNTGAVSRSRGYCDYFYQLVRLPAFLSAM